ncbi:hypothetical protein EON83_20770 [bacterium]|nr:MAG: hypothetical protein EON83_20770 [bacterium]
MEIKDLKEKVEWEAQRVAAAFGGVEWHPDLSFCPPEQVEYRGKLNDFDFGCRFDESGRLVSISIDYFDEGRYRTTRIVKDDLGQWHGHYRPGARVLMARGSYCLGIEEEQILAGYGEPYLLSAHEKLELRLSMPREFWPQKWLDEQAQ